MYTQGLCFHVSAADGARYDMTAIQLKLKWAGSNPEWLLHNGRIADTHLSADFHNNISHRNQRNTTDHWQSMLWYAKLCGDLVAIWGLSINPSWSRSPKHPVLEPPQHLEYVLLRALRR
jgi:hypothetical protein